MGVAVSPNGQKVYALISATKEIPGDKISGLYRSDDGGNTWVLANNDKRLTGRGWYFNQPTIDPNNADVVYVPNVALYRLDEGGKKLSIVRGAPGGDDYHQLWIDPSNSARMVLGTDQGATVSVDGGKTWSSWFNQPIGQFYHVTTDNGFPYAVYGAQQDSGSAAVYSRTDHGVIAPMDWFLVGGGESGWIVVDPNDQNILYVTSAYGGVSRFDRRTSLEPGHFALADADVEHGNRCPQVPRTMGADAGNVSGGQQRFAAGHAVRDEDHGRGTALGENQPGPDRGSGVSEKPTITGDDCRTRRNVASA